MIKIILGHYMSSGGEVSSHPSWENSTCEWPHFGLNLYRRLECYQWYLTETIDVGVNTLAMSRLLVKSQKSVIIAG
jgi:hypothetical protein